MAKFYKMYEIKYYDDFSGGCGKRISNERYFDESILPQAKDFLQKRKQEMISDEENDCYEVEHHRRDSFKLLYEKHINGTLLEKYEDAKVFDDEFSFGIIIDVNWFGRAIHIDEIEMWNGKEV